jgi:chromosome segregation ATPase
VQVAEREEKLQEQQQTADALRADNEDRAQSISAREAATFELQQQLGEQQAQLQQQADELQTAMHALQVCSVFLSAWSPALNTAVNDTSKTVSLERCLRMFSHCRLFFSIKLPLWRGRQQP